MDYEAWKATWGLSLNAQQEAAVRAEEGPVLLLAVPGSGKTTVLLHRLGYLIFCRGVAPERILTVTYTVAATREMARRFARLFGEELAGRLEFRTINGLAARVIRRYERQKGRKAFDLVTDEGTLSALAGQLYHKATGEYATESAVKALRVAITYIKNRQLTRRELADYHPDGLPMARLYDDYCAALRSRGWMDYDDQMVYAAQILRRHGDILAWFQNRYQCLCVDEAQDTSRIQHTILRLLAGRRQNLFLVGDEDQSIYGFRAAEPEALLRFEEDYPGGRVLLLEKNYRSTAPIVAAADAFIRRNQNRRDKHMTAVRGSGPAIGEIWVEDRGEQYAFAARLAAECDRETAVLYRNNDSALPVLDLLDRQGIGCRCRQMEGTFFSNRVIRDVTDFFTLAADPADGPAFLRIYYKLHAGIPRAAAQWAVEESGGQEPILALLARNQDLPQWLQSRCLTLAGQFALLARERGDQAVCRLRTAMGYGDYLKERGMDPGKLDILEALGRHTPTPAALLDRLEELHRLVQQGSGSADSPFLLSTIHSSKGLEYQRVILMDVVDGLLPQAEPPKDCPPEAPEVRLYEEERRLFYVAMTRAKDELAIFRFRKEGLKSTFAQAVFPQKPAAGKKRVSPLPKPRWSRGKKRSRPDLAPFVPGARVRHRTFGVGEILSRQGDIVTVRFDGGGEKRLSLSVAAGSGQLLPV